MNMQELIHKAKSEIELQGWTVEEHYQDDESMHLVLYKGAERKAWGVFHKINCWSEAYREICGKDLLSLI